MMDDSEEGLIGALNSAASSSGRVLQCPPLPAILESGAVSTEELRKAVQVDLNDEAQLGDLEDPTLMGHMDEARAQLADQLRAAAELPAMESIMASEVSARRRFSLLTNTLRDCQRNLATARDNILLQSTNAEKMSMGLTPHGFPAGDARCTNQLKHLSSAIDDVGNAVAQICDALDAAQCEMTRARREIETATVGFGQRCEHYESAWNELSITLK